MNTSHPTPAVKDERLKLALARMLPKLIGIEAGCKRIYWLLYSHRSVVETEMLHMVWMVEQELSDLELNDYMYCFNSIREYLLSEWQYRAAYLCKVKGAKVKGALP